MPGIPPVSSPPRPRRPRSKAPIPPAPRRRAVRSRVIEKNPPQHGEKPYEQLVADAFEGPALRLSNKLKLLEEADTRKIRRGDAIDLITATQAALEGRHAVKRQRTVQTFVIRYAMFAACYVVVALIWCVILTR